MTGHHSKGRLAMLMSIVVRQECDSTVTDNMRRIGFSTMEREHWYAWLKEAGDELAHGHVTECNRIMAWLSERRDTCETQGGVCSCGMKSSEVTRA